jgi:hypothetical protein
MLMVSRNGYAVSEPQYWVKPHLKGDSAALVKIYPPKSNLNLLLLFSRYAENRNVLDHSGQVPKLSLWQIRERGGASASVYPLKNAINLRKSRRTNWPHQPLYKKPWEQFLFCVVYAAEN